MIWVFLHFIFVRSGIATLLITYYWLFLPNISLYILQVWQFIYYVKWFTVPWQDVILQIDLVIDHIVHWLLQCIKTIPKGGLDRQRTERGCVEYWCVWDLLGAELRVLRPQFLADGAGKFNLWKCLWDFSLHLSQNLYRLFHRFIDDFEWPVSPFHPITLQSITLHCLAVWSVEKSFIE